MKLDTPPMVAALAAVGAWAAQGHDLSAQAMKAPGWFSPGAVQTPGTAAPAASFSPCKPVVRFYNDANYFYDAVSVWSTVWASPERCLMPWKGLPR